MDPNNKYTIMQKNHYESHAHIMNEANHKAHNANPDYWSILLKGVKEHPEWNCFDFGCGCGRNVINLLKLGIKRADGGDISEGNIKHCIENVEKEFGDYQMVSLSRFFVLNGIEINGVENDYYDFVMSTIVLQHIPVYTIRYNILKGKYRILKEGGVLSFQMGLDKFPHPQTEIPYYDDFYDAEGTNSKCDVYIEDPQNVIDDLEKIGFKNITFEIKQSFLDHHHNWVYFRGEK